MFVKAASETPDVAGQRAGPDTQAALWHPLAVGTPLSGRGRLVRYNMPHVHGGVWFQQAVMKGRRCGGDVGSVSPPEVSAS